MDQILIDNHGIHFCRPEIADLGKLLDYLANLSEESKKRFGPHVFSREELVRLFNDHMHHLFTAKSIDEDLIIAYAILKMGWLDFEYSRLAGYGLMPEVNDCTIAPSVADAWQGKGLGTHFINYLVEYAKKHLGMRRMILWGGVQSDNVKAVRLYQKTGFRKLGQFEHNGLNLDMLLEM